MKVCFVQRAESIRKFVLSVKFLLRILVGFGVEFSLAQWIRSILS